MYFTSWDANVFLCLLSVFPEEVVRVMIKMVKEMHDDYVHEESLEYWLSLPDPGGTIGRVGKANRAWWKKRKNLKEFSELWRWRCPESRRDSIVRWTSSDWEWRCSRMELPPQINLGKGTSREGYWNSGEAYSYSILDRNIDTSEWSEDEEVEYFSMKEKQRRGYVGEWYKNIHEGRYFLFFEEHDILDSKVYDNYRLQDIIDGSFKTVRSIWDLGDRWQTAQDLLTLDGGGLGQKPDNHIEHIDDLFP